jgi:hypothetical protein
VLLWCNTSVALNRRAVGFWVWLHYKTQKNFAFIQNLVYTLNG